MDEDEDSQGAEEEEEFDDEEEEGAMVGLDEDVDSDDDVKAPPKSTIYSKFKDFIKGRAAPAQTYGPPYLEGMPKIDKTLIAECDMPEPSVKDVHAILNEGVNPNVYDPASYNDTPLIKLARHCYTKQSIKICERLKEAGVKVSKCNILGITPLGRACMARAPFGPPEDQRVKFIEWLIENKAELNPIDKGGFTPMYHAVANGDIRVTKLLISKGVLVRPNLTCKNPVDIARKNNQTKLEVLLSKQLMKEEQEKKREKLEREKALERAKEHRRLLAIKMAENSKLSGKIGPKYKIDKLTLEESQAMARAAYDKSAADAIESSKRKDAERLKQIELLKQMESKYGIWQRVGKGKYRFLQQGSENDEETNRTMALAQSLYDEITFGPRERKLRVRWREKTGLQKRDPLPPIFNQNDDGDDRKPPKSIKQNQKKLMPSSSSSTASRPPGAIEPSERSEWLSFPGI
eukprot:CAMPEP_0114379504 /NCGR_PEP_ID=MMETSP0102-20121206/2276_1 /TAXON_ID=38822 ORGANISM="Pteridomonas danica, Strain PT" /NCGR_SAMPLE_ID=MMETSP0102 /ASSEMBLY_ACC=CAM_ASM_000212 /LENGTH=461 /DNA_ID=CAMNT_0001534573 /DNA_START=11 /DNA_END=1393 /DNA_ORIENTATION=-